MFDLCQFVLTLHYRKAGQSTQPHRAFLIPLYHHLVCESHSALQDSVLTTTTTTQWDHLLFSSPDELKHRGNTPLLMNCVFSQSRCETLVLLNSGQTIGSVTEGALLESLSELLKDQRAWTNVLKMKDRLSDVPLVVPQQLSAQLSIFFPNNTAFAQIQFLKKVHGLLDIKTDVWLFEGQHHLTSDHLEKI